jgi:hypothetical protein
MIRKLLPGLLGATVLVLASCEKEPPTRVSSGALESALRGRPIESGGSNEAVRFSGEATGLRATVLGSTTTLSQAGPIPSSGGADEASLLTATVPGTLTARVLHASTIGQGDRSRSEASAADLDLTVAGQSVRASFLMARAEAICTNGGPQTRGSSEIANLVINGTPVTVSGSPNQTIVLPAGAGRVVINEQSGSPGSIRVTALHVVVTGVADVIVASAHADIACQGRPSCVGGDFVTGGGWITGTPSGAKGTFGVAGGIKNGSFWGHLTYIDHGPGGPKVKGTGVTAYTSTGPTSRRIEGTCTIDGAGGSYRVDVADNGEPGRSDTFDLRLSNGYHASGALGGGNIQLHMPCR